MPFLYEIIIISVMLFFNAIFAAYEMALASISRARLIVLVNRKKKGAAESAFMKDRMEASLAVVQVGITLAGAIAAATGGAGITESFVPYLKESFGLSDLMAEILGLIVLIIPLSALTIVFAELVPKMYALNNREWICLTLSPAMKILSFIAYPVINLFELIVKGILKVGSKTRYLKKRTEDQMGLHELTAAASLARATRLIGAQEEKIVLSAAQLSVRPVKDIMIPAADIFVIPAEVSLADALLRAHWDLHTRFPVCAREGDPQTIIGYLNFKDIIMALRLNPADPSIKGIIRPIKSIQGDTPISQGLETMMQERLHIALVASKDKIVGMITLEDIIEELVGEIEDEYDRLPVYIHPYPGGWIVGGGAAMSLVAQTAGVPWSPDGRMDPNIRLADWISKKLAKTIKGGETIEADGLQVTVRKLRRKKVSEASVNVANKLATELLG